MELVEVRRLTGPNLVLDGPGAVVDVRCDDPGPVSTRLVQRVGRYLQALAARSEHWRDWPRSAAAGRAWADDTGFTWAFEAPVDRLYAACAVLEAAWDDVVAGTDEGDLDGATLATIDAEAVEERDQRLLDVLAAAANRNVPALWDDDELSVGLAAHATTWPRGEVPAPDEIAWDAAAPVPVALVTGTNGKSTTVRMLSAIVAADGQVVGSSSTDGIVVDGELVERGDWSGPGGGRTVGRREDVEVMVLECARGGLLRRGLPVDRADVAVVTNVAEDHLGEYGIETVEDLAQAKLVVAKAVRDSGVLVTNAEDALLLSAAPPGPRTWWFGLDPGAPPLTWAVADGGTVATVVDGVLTLRDADGDTPVVAVADIPATHGGAAAHNVRNAAAAVLAAHALDVGPTTIAAGLRAFAADADTNPGRANRYELHGVTVVVDFAHNVHGVAAMAELVAALPARRRLVLFSQAGDRGDDALDGLAGAVAGSGADRYVCAEVPGYLRGRAPMEVPRRLRAGLLDRGVPDDAVRVAEDAVLGVEQALDWAQPGDVLLLLVLEHRDEVRQLLLDRGAVTA